MEEIYKVLLSEIKQIIDLNKKNVHLLVVNLTTSRAQTTLEKKMISNFWPSLVDFLKGEGFGGTVEPHYPRSYYLRFCLFTYEKLAKYLVKMCLFICQFSIRGPK